MKARSTPPALPYTCDRDLRSEAKPWTEPLDIRLLSILPSDNLMDNLSSSAKRDGRRDLEELPVQKTAKSTSNDDFDFESQFQHARSDYDSENADENDQSSGFQCSKELLDLIQMRVKKFEKLARKHRDRERKRIAQSRNGPRVTNREADVSNTQVLSSFRESNTLTNRSKSFVQGLSCGFSSFLSRPSKNSTESKEVPARLNRLHGADKSSMSVLSPTLRTEFLRMSYTRGRPRENLHRGRPKPQSFSAPRWNSFVEHNPNNLSCRDLSTNQTTTADSDMVFQNVEKRVQTKASEWGAVECAGEEVRGKLVEHDPNYLSSRDSSTHQTTTADYGVVFQTVKKQVQTKASEWATVECADKNLRGKLAASKEKEGMEQTGSKEEVEGRSQEALEDTGTTCLAPLQGILSDSASEIAWRTVCDAQKWELPVSISDLIEQYDTADTLEEEGKSQCDESLAGSSQVELPFDINRVRSLFEQAGDAERDEVRTRCRAERRMSSIDSRTPMNQNVDRLLGNEKTEKKRFGMRMEGMSPGEVSPTSNEADHISGAGDSDVDGTMGMEQTDSPTDAEEAEVSSKVEKGEQSFMSSITSSESLSQTPSSQKAISPGLERLGIMSASEKEWNGWKLEERGMEIHDNGSDQETKPGVASNRGPVSATGERMNLGDLFDSMELSCNGERKQRGEPTKDQQEKVGFRSTDNGRGAARDGDKALRSARRRRAMSFVARRETAGRGSDRQGNGDRRRTEGVATREESKMRSLVRDHRQRVIRRLVLIRNIVSADDY